MDHSFIKKLLPRLNMLSPSSDYINTNEHLAHFWPEFYKIYTAHAH